jgi:hypothetical protein
MPLAGAVAGGGAEVLGFGWPLVADWPIAIAAAHRIRQPHAIGIRAA